MTGAGRGLGRVEALELARLGARVVVNDLGTRGDGAGSDRGPAEAVVEEIRKAGGEAVAHFGDVADWNDAQSLIKKAVDEFGDLNILVNNAGFCRDQMPFPDGAGRLLWRRGDSVESPLGEVVSFQCMEARLLKLVHGHVGGIKDVLRDQQRPGIGGPGDPLGQIDRAPDPGIATFQSGCIAKMASDVQR